MGPLTLILGLPLAPFRGVIKLGELVQDRVNAELTDVSSARRELEAAEEARQAGEISAEEEVDVQHEVVDRMTDTPGGE